MCTDIQLCETIPLEKYRVLRTLIESFHLNLAQTHKRVDCTSKQLTSVYLVLSNFSRVLLTVSQTRGMMR